MEKFKKMINEEISKLEKEIKRINSDKDNIQKKKDIYNKLMGEFSSVNSSKNVNLAFSIDMGLLENIFGDTESVMSDIRRIKELKAMYNMFYIDNNQSLEIIKICKKYSELLRDKIELLDKEISNRDNMEATLVEYQNIKNKLSGNINFNDIIEILNFIKGMNIPLKDKIEVIKEVNAYSFNIEINNRETSPNTEENEEIVDVVNVVNNDIEDIKNLFTKYGYDIYTLFKNGDIDRIVKYGNISNMEDILKELSDIKLNNDKKQSTNLSKIFVLSSGEIVKAIINNIKTDLRNNLDSSSYDLNEIFNYYIDLYPIFIKGAKLYKKKNNSENDGHGSLESGAFNNYIDIRDIILKEDSSANINDMIRKCGSVFVKCNRSSFARRLDKFKLYGAKKENYFGTLSSFLGDYSLDIIDVFRELGHDKYLFNGGFSTTCRNVDVINMTLMLIKLYNKRGDSIYFKEPDGKNKSYKLKGYISAVNASSSKARVSVVDTRELVDMGLIVKTSDVAFPKRDGEKGVILSETGRYGNYSNSYYRDNITKYEEYDRVILESGNDSITSISLNNVYIKELDDAYKVSEHLYNIDGIMISRLKVLRMFETLISSGLGNLDGLFVAITRNSILTKDELERLDKEIRGNKYIHNEGSVKTLRRSGN